MFGFLKELVASAKEGIDEAKQEFAEEQAAAAGRTRAEQEAYAASLAAEVAAASGEERFAVALGAIYRETFLQELNAARKQERPASYLHVTTLPPDEVSGMESLLRRDFGARDEGSVVDAAELFVRGLGLNEETDALLIARGSWLVTAATGAGLLDASRMPELTEPFMLRAGDNYTSWADYGQRFLAAEREASGSNPIGRKQLAKTIDRLLTTSGSPWHDQPWPGRTHHTP